MFSLTHAQIVFHEKASSVLVLWWEGSSTSKFNPILPRYLRNFSALAIIMVVV